VQDDPKHPVSVAIRRFAEREVIALGLSSDPAELRADRRGLMKKRRPRS
jgi:hypothetical protein